MLITDNHVEWAVVRRWREILDDPPDTEFDVTLAFATFSSIVCWTVERMRARDSRARLAWVALERVCFADFLAKAARVPPNLPVELATLSAAKGIVWVRHVLAHGDARNIRPMNSKPGRRGEVHLLGFRLAGSDPAATLDLDANTMKSFAISLADRFCDAFGHQSGGASENYFVTEAKKGVVLNMRTASAQ